MRSLLPILSGWKRSNRFAGIRRYTNLLYYDKETVTLRLRDFDIVGADGFRFYMSKQVVSVRKVINNEWFEGVKPTDTVVDIGANIGAITIPLAKAVKKVYAIEPVYSEELGANIKLNNLTNIEVFSYGILLLTIIL